MIGYFEEQNSKKCISCNSRCKTCKNNPENCIECSANRHLNDSCVNCLMGNSLSDASDKDSLCV